MLSIRFSNPRHADPRTYNRPTAAEVAVVFVSEEESNPTPPMVLLPKSALLPGEGNRVFVIVNGLAEERSLTLRDDFDNDLIEVGAGLIGGETVINNPPADLQNGDPVQIGGNR